MSNSTQPSILCPLPRRTHSNPIYNTTKPSIPPRNNQKKLGQELASSDDVLSEFLSLFTPPSEPNRQSILIYNNHLDSSIQPQDQSNHSSQPTSPIRTTTSTPLSSSSSSSPPPSSSCKPIHNHSNKPTAQPNHPQPTDHPEHSQPQFGLAVAPNHLSSIVSSPISRCHNPLPRHAELDALACRLAKPFKSFALDQDHLPSNGEDEERAMEQTQSDHPLSALMPALTLEHSVSSLNDP
ncbi:hypothetical protein PTTG_08652 [Puccinia triticina 1-1 BBBD Race 1]|uniref:Uncharacterized protein n=1 Tax=Puccinia triticina (isolate 1-1 / race 1 (BBBD)) TaxID=630390 RepID=A0A0C4F688_PUCT1|nr:hypothetical protein PTTG_08652 [Puccinia triticina 1-1 BBBD Race 1]